MTPTPEQVAQWAREASKRYEDYPLKVGEWHLTPADLHRLVTRAMAEQAEADAKLCEREAKAWPYPSHGNAAASIVAAAIRANAPKVTT